MGTTNMSNKELLINKNMRPLGGDSCAGEDECKTWMDEMRFTGLIKEKNGILTPRCGWQLKERQAAAITKSNLRSGLGYECHPIH